MTNQNSAVASQGELPIGDQFRAAFRHHPGGVSVITAKSSDGTHVALTATSLASVSLEPPLVVFSVSAISSSAPVLNTAEHVIVHFIDSGAINVAKIGSTSGIDRFEDTSLWTELETGERVYKDAPVWMRCKIVNRIDASGSTLLLAEVLDTSLAGGDGDPRDSRDPLVYINRAWHKLTDASRIE